MRALAVFLFLALCSLGFSQTITNPRTAAEYEEVRGVVIRWDEKEYYKIFTNAASSGWTSYWTGRYYGTMYTQSTIVREALNEGLEVYVIDDTSHTGKYGPYLYSDYHVADTLAALGIGPSSHLHIILYPALPDDLEKVWIRDWGPYTIYRNGVESSSIAGRDLNSTIASYLPKPFISTTVMDGGNFLTDGHRRLICDQNATYIDQNLFGLNDLVAVANYKIHIDYYMKLINEETFIVNEIPSSNHDPSVDTFFGDSTALEGAISVMKQRTSCYGRPYKFIRIKAAPTYNQGGLTYITSEAGYANSLILNRTVLVPTYDNPATDTVALSTYREAMPGYRIVGIQSKYYAARQGAIHCITKEFPQDDPIFIAHAWYPDTISNQGGYEVRAYIKTPTGVSHAEVNWTLNVQNGFQAVVMTQVATDTFSATIPGQPSGNVLSYYISATSNSGRQVVRPTVAPAGNYSTYLKGTTVGCQISCPSNILVKNSTGQCGATVNYPAPTTTGSCGTMTSTPASGSFFPIGTTTVSCTTASGPSCSFTVTVADTQKPVLSCHADTSVDENPPGSGGAVVNYAAPSALDNCPGVSVSSTPASGSTFPRGTTMVVCRATDASGNKDSCTFTVTVVNPVTTYMDTLSRDWNLISFPLIVPDPRRTTVYPEASSGMFAYDGRYVLKDSMKGGLAYWIKFPSGETRQMSGTPVTAETISVHLGWNMIGSVISTIPAGAVSSIPPSITASNFFGYAGNYYIADTLRPFRGYWVKASGAGKLILSPGSPTQMRSMPLSELPPPPPEGEAISRPQKFSLAQNFPNPFNPSTVISFSIPEKTHVTLQIYTLLGDFVETILDEDKEAGTFSVRWDARDRAAGAYFYRIFAGSVVRSGTMVLLK